MTVAEIAEQETSPMAEAPDTAQNPKAEATPTPDGEAVAPEAGQDQPKDTPTLLTKEQPVVPVVPESYDLTLPENTPLDPTVTERVTAIAKELGLTDAAHAQRVLDAIHGESLSALDVFQKAVAKGGTVWKATVERLEAEALADQEIGGSPEQLQRSVTNAKAVLAKYASTELQAWLEETGQGSHPEFIRMLTRMHKATGEDTMELSGTPPKRPKSRAERMYSTPPSP